MSFVLPLLVSMVAVQVALGGLARWLGRRLPWDAALVATLLPVIVLAPWLSAGVVLAPTDLLRGQIPGAPAVEISHQHGLLNDVVLQFLPWEREVRRAFAAGHLPLWSDAVDGGSSPWANPTARVLAPISWLARAFPLERFLLVSLLLSMQIAYAGCWLLARRLGVRRVPAHLAAASLTLGGGVQSFGLFPHAAVVAWVPWATVAVIGWWRDRGGEGALPRVPTGDEPARAAARLARGRLAAMVLLFAFVLLSGHAVTAVLGVGFAIVCGLWLRRRSGGLRVGRRRVGPRDVAAAWRSGALGARGAGLVLALLLAGGLAAVQWLPFVALVDGAQRQAWLVRLTLDGLAQDGVWQWLWPKLLPGVANPHALGVPFRDPVDLAANWVEIGTPYAGLLGFAAVGLVLLDRRRRRAVPLLALAAAGLLVGTGFVPALLPLVGSPLRVLANHRPLFLVAWALPLMVGLAVDGLLRGRRRGASVVLAAAVLFAAAASSLALRLDRTVLLLWLALLATAGLLLATRGRSPSGRRTAGETARTLGAASADPPAVSAPAPRGASNPAAGRARGSHRSARWGLVGLALVVFADLAPWAWRRLPFGPPELFYPPTAAVTVVEREVAEGGPWRAVGVGYATYPAILPFYGIDDPRPHNPLVPMRYLGVLTAALGFGSEGAYYEPIRYAEHPLLDFLGVRVVIVNQPLPSDHGLVQLDAGELGSFAIYRNPLALPRFFLPTATEVVVAEALPVWLRQLTDGRRVAVAPGERATALPDAAAWNPRAVRVIAARPGRVRLALPSTGERLLATSLPGPAGWRAIARGRAVAAVGRELPTLTINGAFLGVRVEDGIGELELAYRPPGFTAGLVLSSVSALLLFGLLLGSRRWAHRADR